MYKRQVVYVATGRNFPDALAGSTLAGALGAPLLTVEPNPPLPQATIDALTALDPDRIVIFGGPGAVSAEVLEALIPYTRSQSVTRIAGDNRHDTARAIADALPTKVHDSDLLDGLDSTDFLRTTDADDFVHVDDSIDAAALDGHSLAELSQIGIPLSALQLFNGATLNMDLSDDSGLVLPDGSPWFYFSFVIPLGMGHPFEPVVDLYVSSLDTSCTIGMQENGSQWFRVGEVEGPRRRFEQQPKTVSLGADPSTTHRMTWRLEAPTIEPSRPMGGDAVHLGFLRNGTLDTCTDEAIIEAVVIRFESVE